MRIKLVLVLLFISSLVSQSALENFGNETLLELKASSHRSIFQSLEIEPLDPTLSTSARAKLTVEFIDSLDILIVSKKIDGIAVSIPVVMRKMAYQVSLDIKYSKDALQSAALKKAEQDNLGLGGSDFKFGTNLKSKAIESIFGSSEVSISINGNIEIDVAGKTTSQEGAINSLQQQNQGSFSPALKLKQQFYLEGKIGDKLSITANQNSETDFDLENVIKIKYQGYEDEVVQSIEAGNVSLSLPGSSLISNTEKHQGLFGVKAKLQYGDMYFTGIASVIKGQKQKKSFKKGGRSGSSSDDGATLIKDYDYVKYRFFFVDTLFRNTFEDYFPTKDPTSQNTLGTVTNLNVYVSADNLDPVSEKRWATAVVNEDFLGEVDTVLAKSGIYETIEFRKLQEGADYGYDKDLGYFYLNRDYENKSIAISYEFLDKQSSSLKNLPWMTDANFNTKGNDRDSYLNFRNNSTEPRYLKLIKSKDQKRTNNSQVAYQTLERLHMKNVYNFNYITNEELKVEIYEQTETQIGPQEPEKFKELTFLNIFGLDRLNADQAVVNDNRGDGVIDYSRKVLFEPTGKPRYLVFPFLQPFEPSAKAQSKMNEIKLKESSGNFQWDSSFQSDKIYNYSSAIRVEKYTIKVDGKSTGASSTSSSESNEFDIAFGIIEGSERVLINGETMIRGQDYEINYFTGLLVLTSNRAILGKTSLEVEYETPNLFQLDKQTLLGGRLEYKFDQGFVGGTALYLKKSSLDEKVRIGQEPFENFAWGLNGRYETKVDFMTDFANFLPGVQSKAESKFKIDAEFAHLIPNPNTQNNEAIGENDGVAYIDDFEAAKRASGLSLNRVAWLPASLPKMLNGEIVNSVVADSGRAQSTFFNPFAPYKSTFILDRETSRNVLDEIQILNFLVRKETKIYDENNQEILVEEQDGKRKFKAKTPREKAWAGIMASNRHNSDLTNTRFLELWVRWDYPDKNGVEPVLNIDFGSISEDFYTKDQTLNILASQYKSQNDDFTEKVVLGRGLESSEDVSGSIEDNILQDDEDVGLDRMSDSEEAELYGVVNPYDNWKALKDAAKSRYFAGLDNSIFDSEHDLNDDIKSILPWRINGTEGNSAESSNSRFPDKEDIDRDGAFDVNDNYFHVEIPMKRSIEDIQDHPYFAAIGKEKELGWVQFRIPIRDLIEEGSYYPSTDIPSLTSVDFIRVYIDRFDDLDDDDVILMNFAGIDFVGTDWQTIPPKNYDDISFTNAEIGKESDEIEVRFLNSDENQNTLSSADFYADYYISPPGVQGDFVDAERTTRGKEQSMILDIKDLKAGQRAEVYKSSQFIAQNFSLHNYKKIKMFMRTQLLDINETSNEYALPKTREEFKAAGAHRNYFYVKFGSTSENFYEYRVPMIANKLPDEFTEPNSENTSLQRAYWENSSIEIDLDLLSAVKNRGFQERFAGKYNAYYLYENPQDTLMERYRAVGNPDVTNLRYVILGVYNADDISQNTRPLTSHVWVNELRASEVRKEDATAIKMSMSTNVADLLTVSANFSNLEADYHQLNRTSSGKSSANKESQTYNFVFSPHKFLPKTWGLNIPFSLSLNNTYSIPKYLPGTDIRTFYRNESVLDKIKHMFGLGDYTDDIKDIYNWTSSKNFSFSIKKNSSKKTWYNRILLDRLSYTGKVSRSNSSSSIIAEQKTEVFSHSFKYSFSFGRDNFIQPFSFLGRGSYLDEISQLKIFYTPESVGANLSLNQNESQLRRREQAADDPVFKATSKRDFGIKYKLTDAVSSSFSRNYSADISTETQDNRQMTITDAFLNIFNKPFHKNAFGNDHQVNTNFQVDYRPRLLDGLATSFSYKSTFSYKEEITKDYSTQGASQSYSYKVGISPAKSFRKLFGASGSKSRSRGKGRGRGTRSRGSKTTPKKDRGIEGKFTADFSDFSNSFDLYSFFQNGKKSKGLDINVLNPLVWGKEFLLSWSKLDFSYETKDNFSQSLLEQKQASLAFQLGFENKLDVATVGETRLGQGETENISIKNSFNFGKVTVDFQNTAKTTKNLQEFGNQKYIKENSYFSLSEDFDNYNSFRSADTLNLAKPLGILIPNWTVRIKGVEKLPLLNLIAKSASIKHVRKGNVKTDYLTNNVSGNSIENYKYTISDSYSPLIGLNIKTKFGFNADFTIGQSKSFSLSSPTSGTRTTKDDLSLSLSYRQSGGFRFPFDFWPFNGAFIKNSIDFSFRFSQRETTPETYRKDNEGRSFFTKGNFSKTLSIEPSISYKFSNTVTGSIFYRFNSTESARIKQLTVNEFGLKVNLRIQN